MWGPGSIIERWTRRPWRFLAIAASLIAILAGLEIGWAHSRSRRLGPLGEAQWIWDPVLELEQAFPSADPVAFFAVGEIDLPARQRRAHLDIVVDEEYVVWLNGSWIGANSYRDGAAIDRYEVGPYLRRGRNRIVIEARSLRSAGGILCRLEVASGEAEVPPLVSDGRWRILRAAVRGLHNPRRDLSEAAVPARVWGRGDVGRWTVRPPEGSRPILGKRLQPPVRFRALTADRRGERWRGLGGEQQPFETLAGDLLFDWGRATHGYPRLHLAEDLPPPALIAIGNEPLDAETLPDQLVITVPGSHRWDATTMRRFRYVLVRGAVLSAPPEVRAVGPRKVDALAAPEPELPHGVFGLEPPPARPRYEEVERRILQDAEKGAG